MRPAMHGIANLCDTWEEFANALSPTPPFHRDLYRLRLAAVLVPLLAASLFISAYAFTKSVSFGIGFGFFGDPVLTPGLRWLNTNYPNWQKLLELRNTLLKGVPTNAQLTLTLLRVGESRRAPLPPPPSSAPPPPDEPVDVSEANLRSAGAEPPLNATPAELNAAMANDPSTKHETSGHDIDASKSKGHSHKASGMLRAVKGSIKGSIQTALGADHLKAKVGSEHSKRRVGAVPAVREQELSGPVEFKVCFIANSRGDGCRLMSCDVVSVPWQARPCISFYCFDYPLRGFLARQKHHKGRHTRAHRRGSETYLVNSSR